MYDSAGNLLGTVVNPLNISETLPAIPANGGYYTACGRTGTAAIAAALATDTCLMAMRFSNTSTRKAYITKVRVQIGIITVGLTALVPGSLGLQRFTTAPMSGGVARVPQENDEINDDTSDMTDIRDNNVALTVTNVVFGTEVAQTIVPIAITGAAEGYEWIFEPTYPIVLQPGDGLTIRTRTAMPATQTWMFSWTVHWYETG